MKSALSTVTIVGVGLIGGSFGLALKRGALAGLVIGAGRSRASLERALELGAIDEVADDFRDAVKRSSFVFLATPVGAIGRIVQEIAPLVSEEAIATDAGSTKARIVEAAQACWAEPVRFVGSHPIAGSEKSGVQHATPDLFKGKIVAITPTGRTNREAARKVADVWQALGASTLEISPKRHDEILAKTSHVPHVVAALLLSLVHDIDSEQTRKLAGTGLRDSTRLAGSSAEMWRDICLGNKGNVKEALDDFRTLLDRAIEYLNRDDEERLFELFRSTIAYRERLFEYRLDTNG